MTTKTLRKIGKKNKKNVYPAQKHIYVIKINLLIEWMLVDSF